MGRWDISKSSSNSRIEFWIMIWVVYLFMFIIVLPPLFGCADQLCGGSAFPNGGPDPNGLLYLWWWIGTLGGGTLSWATVNFGIFAGLLVIGFLDSMD